MNNPPLSKGPDITYETVKRVMKDITGMEDAFNSPLDRMLIELILLVEESRNILGLEFLQRQRQAAMEAQRIQSKR